MSKGGGGLPNSDNDGQGGKGGKKSNILPNVLCEWPLTRLSRSPAGVNEFF